MELGSMEKIRRTSAGGKNMNIKKLDVDELEENPWNPNEMTESIFEHLKKEYERVGILQPILVRPHNETHQIVDGEHRWRAAKQMDIDEITCVVKEMTDEEAKITTLNMNEIKGTNNPIKETEVIMDLKEENDVEELSELLVKSENELKEMEMLMDMPEELELDEEDVEVEDTSIILTFSTEEFEDLKEHFNVEEDLSLEVKNHLLDLIEEG